MQPNPISRMDSAIIGFVEKFAHWFQRLTGRTNFFLAGMINLFLLAACFIAAIRGSSPMDPMDPEPTERTPIDYILLFFLIYIFSEMIIFGWKREEDAAWSRLGRGLSNPRKASPMFMIMRLALLPVLGVLLPIFLIKENLLSIVIGTCWVLSPYLMSCDPLPPCQGKIREWLGSLFAKRATESG